ncbi:MAG: putative glycosyltransferase EpsJ [Syntrophorhabdaceae bacterium PtaU1.Bin034]|nr:MAG: putative glycosyltransferase EpsJ [Syntrophorhabdaceae bacterium PtaU1.Bin034]
MEPEVSVIVPCRNEEKFIDRCLGSVLCSDLPPGALEIIAVDGMSQDSTPALLRRWAEINPNVKILFNPRRIAPIGLNLGIRAARGKWLLFLSAHSEYPKGYVSLCLEAARRTGADNVGGWLRTLPGDSSLQARLVQAATTHRFGVGNARFRVNAQEGPADTVAYGCYRREVFDRIGLFDERLVRNSDYELNRRLASRGGRIWLDPNIRIDYFNQETLAGLMKQAFANGTWNIWMWLMAPHTFAVRHAVPFLFVTVLIGLAGIGIYSSKAFSLLFAFLGAYAVCALGASYQQARGLGWWMMPVLPFLFFAYHVAYGAGTLWGILKHFANKSPVRKKTPIMDPA